MSAYAQIDAYPSNGWLRDEKPLCIDSRTWVGRQVNVVSADPSVCRKRFWGFPSGRRPFAGSSVWRRSFYWPFGSADAPLNRMSQQMRYPSRWTSGRCRPAERPLSRLRMATSVRFRSKQPPILTWSPGFWAVFRGRCSISALPTWENAGGLRPLGSIPPAKPPKSRIEVSPARRNKRGARKAKAQIAGFVEKHDGKNDGHKRA